MDGVAQNTDKEIWREKPGDFCSDSIHVTADGGIGINCGGHVIVKPIRGWYEAARKAMRDGSRGVQAGFEQPEILNEKEYEIIRHTLKYLNEFVAEPNHPDFEILESLIEREFMIKTKYARMSFSVYSCTEKARDLVVVKQ